MMLSMQGLARMRRKRVLAVPVVVAAAALGVLAAVPAPGFAASAFPGGSRSAVLTASAAPKVPAGAVRSGALASGTRLTVEVTLNVRDQSGLSALLAGLADRSSPYFHRFLSPAQFDADFSPTAAQVDAVDAALRAAGLTPGRASADRLSVPVTASAGALEHAFGITLAAYRLRGGRAAYANTTAPKVPAAIAPDLQGILGLDDLYPAEAGPPPGRSAAEPLAGGRAGRPLGQADADAAGPQPCPLATASSLAGNGYTMDELADAYGLGGLYGLGDFGQGARIALLELEPSTPSDIGAFESCYGISTPVSYIDVDGGPSGQSSGEAVLDTEIAAALAPRAAIDVYQAPNSSGGPGTGMYDIFQQFVTSDTDQVMSVSWGRCENESALATLQAQETLFEKANAQGQTIVASAGDDGSTGCYSDNGAGTVTDPNAALSVNAPAGAPYVTAVGGTTIGAAGETAWNDSALDAGAGGGGTSGTVPDGKGGYTGWCMPSYQDQTAIPGLISADSQASRACATGYMRQVPDVSADADPGSGWGVYIGAYGGWISAGGTSASAPMWAAVAALTDQSPYCSGYGSGNAGVLPQALYAAAARERSYIYSGGPQEALYDVTGGDNDYTPSGYSGGRYPATPGYDMATGLGTPYVTGLSPSGTAYSTYYPGYTAMICQQLATRTLNVKGVSPAAGKAGAAATVTIHGTGFLPIAGADLVREYSGATLLATLTPSCTITACTVTLPAEAARTVDLRVSVEDSAYTAAAPPDRYTYAGTPHITALSPTSGTHNGGTKVVIKGTSLIGVTSVTFGGSPGGRVTVTGTTSLTVIAPKGTKGTKVKVAITAAGGTSNTAYYTYS